MIGATVFRPVPALAACAALVAGCGGAKNNGEKPAGSTEGGSSPVATSSPNVAANEATVKQTVRDFYAAITHDDLAGAWATLVPSLRGVVGGYDKWSEGYGLTNSVGPMTIDVTSITRTAAAADVSIRALDIDACGSRVTQSFTGTWTLVRRHGQWRASDITMRKTSGATPVIDPSKCNSGGGSGTRGGGPTQEVCYPGTTIPVVRLPAVDLPGNPSLGIAPIHIPGQTIPAQHVAGTCLQAPGAFAPQNTTVADGDYSAIDSDYSSRLTSSYWESAPDTAVPDMSASGFGELNEAGYPRNQYVRPYFRRDGTRVNGYWRNSPTDGLPTCQVTSC